MQEPQEMQVRSSSQEDPLEEETAARSSILVGIMPRSGEPTGLHSMGPQRIGSDWATKHNSCLRSQEWRGCLRIPSEMSGIPSCLCSPVVGVSSLPVQLIALERLPSLLPKSVANLNPWGVKEFSADWRLQQSWQLHGHNSRWELSQLSEVGSLDWASASTRPRSCS